MEEEARIETRVLQEELSRLNSLLEHSGYKFLMEVAEGQIHARQDTIILKPATSIEDLLTQEYAKGEAAGIKLFRHMAEARMQELRETIEEQLEEEKANEADDVPNLARDE